MIALFLARFLNRCPVCLQPRLLRMVDGHVQVCTRCGWWSEAKRYAHLPRAAPRPRLRLVVDNTARRTRKEIP